MFITAFCSLVFVLPCYVNATSYNGIASTYNAIASANNGIASIYNAIASADNAIASADNAIASADNAIASADNVIASTCNAIVSSFYLQITVGWALQCIGVNLNQNTFKTSFLGLRRKCI